MAIGELENAIGTLATRTNNSTKRLKRDNKQRRNQVTDDFDKEYECIGDKNSRGRIYLAISPDMVYIERWEFKVIVQPFTVPLSTESTSLSPVTLTIDPIEIETPSKKLEIKDGKISPESHTHPKITIRPRIVPETHTHIPQAGITTVPSSFGNLKIYLDGRDFTEAFKSQYKDQGWIDKDGIYPDASMEHRYNILEALDTLPKDKVSDYLKQGYHTLEFEADSLFSIKIREFKKYSFTNRQGDSSSEADVTPDEPEEEVPTMTKYDYEKKLESLKKELEKITNESKPDDTNCGVQVIWELKHRSNIRKYEIEIEDIEKILREWDKNEQK